MRSCQSGMERRLSYRAMPYPPPARARLRLAFVGQSTFFEACALGDEPPAFETRFVEFRRAATPARCSPTLDAFAPHVVVVFRPEIMPAGRVRRPARADARLPHRADPARRGAAHPDLERRLRELAQVDAGNFDRIVVVRPADRADRRARSCRSGARCRCRSPTATTAPVAADAPAGRGCCSSAARPPHREQMLTPAKPSSDVLHDAFGVGADELERAAGRARRRHQPPQRALPVVREPRLPAPRRRATSCSPSR